MTLPHTSLFALALAVLAPVGARAEELPPSLTLDEALGRLEAQNLTLAQAKGRAEEAKGLVRQAMAGFLPTLGAGGSYVRNSASAKLSLNTILDAIEGGLNTISPKPVHLDRTGVPSTTVIQPLEAFNGQATLRVPLFAANAYPDYLAAAESSKAVEASVEATRLQLKTVLVQSAWWGAATEEIADAADRALGIAQEQERSAARAVQAGTAAPLSRLQAQTDAVRRENDVVRTRADRQRAWLALGVLLGEARPVRIEVPAEPPMPHDTVEALTERALSGRPELRSLEATLNAAQWQLDSAWWRLFPQLSASGSAFVSNVAYVTGETTWWKASVDLTWTLFDGGFRYGKRTQAAGQLASARAGLAAQKVEVSQQVQDARRDVEVAKERLRLAEKQRGLAMEVQASAKRSFEAGLASSLDVLDANDKLYQADVGLADAKARVGMMAAALARATGQL